MSNAWDQTLAKRYGDKLAPKAAPTADTGESEDAISRRVIAEVRERAMGIVTACNLAGASARAAGFIAEGKTVSEVVAALGGERTRPRG